MPSAPDEDGKVGKRLKALAGKLDQAGAEAAAYKPRRWDLAVLRAARK
jgi:hypothetical protein